ncbi:hypothetical protein H0H93_003104 [Arthromyces matolae]|nr:hypothetical protein H0H93_003104 [Arthromyces matolae]
MASDGGYDGPHQSSSYGHAASWRPSTSSSWVDRDYYDRRQESPSRRYSTYDGSYSQENNYRPSNYRHEDADPYYSRSPNPDHYPRYPPWGTSEAWNGSSPWEDPVLDTNSPTASTSKAWRDPLLATRMFEPSDTWKQTHQVPLNLEPLIPIIPVHGTLILTAVTTIVQWPLIEMHIRGTTIIGLTQVGVNGTGVHQTQVLKEVAKIHPILGIPEKALVLSLSSVRDRRNEHLISNRGRAHRTPGHSIGSSASGLKKDTSAKYSWDRPIAASGTSANFPAYNRTLPSAQQLQKESWTRSNSRSSIASTQASDSAPSQPTKSLLTNAKELDLVTTMESKDVGRVSNQVTKSPHVEKGLSSVVSGSDGAMPSTSIANGFQAQDKVTSTADPAASGSQPGVANFESRKSVAEKETPSEATSAPVPQPTTESTSQQTNTVTLTEERQTAPRTGTERTVVTSLPTPLPTPQPTPTLTSDNVASPFHQEAIPTEASSLKDALRIVAMTRLLCDHQSRDERVEPVLKTNNLRASLNSQDVSSPDASKTVIEEVSEGPRHEQRMVKFAQIKNTLVERFEERQNALTEKIQRLRKEYTSLHERWTIHCNSLDEQNKAAIPEPELIQPTGRTTRRSAATLGDAVRSDLEMEQIIASLGYDEATDPNHLSLRNLATIPDMISVTRGNVDYTFDDTNHRVENPAEYYGPQTGIHDWTEDEKKIFLDKFAAFPKQFGMIAEHLPNKTAAQCVDYYYLHKKQHIDFRKVVSQYAPNKRKRGRTGKKKGNALLADIRQHDAEVHGESEAPKSSGRPSRGRKPLIPPEPKETKKAPPSRRRGHLDLTPSADSGTPTPEPETRRRGRRSAAAAPLSRTVSTGQDEAEEEVVEEDSERPAKRARRGGRKVVKSAATVGDEPSDPEGKSGELPESSGRRRSGANQWSEEDKNIFLTLLAQYGDNFKRIAASMPNKTSSQVSNFYRMNCDGLGLEAIVAGAPKRSPTPVATDGSPNAPPPIVVQNPDMEASGHPVSSLVPEPSRANGVSNTQYSEASTHDIHQAPASWPPPAPHPPSPASHSRDYYHMNSRTNPYYHSHHSIPSQGYPPQPVPYTYPPYSTPHYPQYDPHAYHRLPQYSMTQPSRHMPTRTRENAYPMMHQGQASYHYSLEP